MLWHLQRDLYDVRGIHAWSRGNVPQSITTSPYIARAYAQIVIGYLRDIAAQLDRSQPVYIVEFGAEMKLVNAKNTVGPRNPLDSATILMPIAGLACIRHFGELSRNRALFILGDIGSARETDFSEHTSGGMGDDSNFWLSVNFHAVGEYVRQLGGSVLHPPRHHA